MKNIKNFILEKLKITKDTKINDNTGLRDLSSVHVTHGLAIDMMFRSQSDEDKHFKKMEEYKKKGSKPERLLNSIKDKIKLMYRWYIAIKIDWLECAKVFRQGIIDRGYYNGDELDAFVMHKYENVLKNSKLPNVKEAVAKYLDEFKVKYNY